MAPYPHRSARPGKAVARFWTARAARGMAAYSTIMTRRQFEALVDKSLRRLPRKFRERISNIAVVVEDWADDATLAEMGIEPPDTLYGLYRGVDLTHRDSMYGNVLPDVITIYQGPITEDASDADDMAEIVRETVIHEVGHYFGLDDETMHRIENGEDL